MPLKVSVLMPVYNAEKYLQEAIDSILTQTYKDFEFLIINDGSTDRSCEIIDSYNDNRIRLIKVKNNVGVTKTLNIGLNEAKGEYIVRMDADDISLPDRLEKQVIFMQQNPQYGLCGSWIERIDCDKSFIWKPSCDSEIIKCQLLFGTPFAHSSVIIRSNILKEYKLLYDDSYKRAQDYELWARASKVTSITAMNHVLVKYRLHDLQIGHIYLAEQDRDADRVRFRFFDELGIRPNEDELWAHKVVRLGLKCTEKHQILIIKNWLEKLNTANKDTKVFPVKAFNQLLSEKWFKCCYSFCEHGWWAYKTYYNSVLSKYSSLDYKTAFKFNIKCGLKYSRGKWSYRSWK